MLKKINELNLNDKKWVGGKAWNLFILNKNGFNIPDAYVIHYSLDLTKNKTKILELFKELNCDEVSVRSSATLEDSDSESFAGQFDTFLNVKEDNLISMIQKCRDGINSERVQSYIKEKKIDATNLQVAVIVQKMIQSDLSGVAFSVDPIKQNPNHIIVEAIKGLGEKLVSGTHKPYKIIFDKNKKQILHIDSNISLPTELFQTIINIEKVYKTPVDIEFAYQDNELYILQTRPVTTFEISKPTLNSFHQKLKDGYWKKGSIWEFDWYINSLFAEEMAFGSNPVYIGYEQAIIGDLFLDPNSEYLSYSDFFNDLDFVNELIQKQKVILEKANYQLKQIKNGKFNKINYEIVQRQLSLLMASVSASFDLVMSLEIKEISNKNKIAEDVLSQYVLKKSSKTKLNESNEKLLEMFSNKLKLSSYKSLTENEKAKLEKHAKLYGWLNTGERGCEEWSAEDFYNQFIELLKIKKEYINEEIILKKLSKRDKTVLESIIEVSLNDNLAADLQVELDYYFQQHLKKVLGDFYNERILEKLTYDEILKVIEKPQTINEYENRLKLVNICWQENGELIKMYIDKKSADTLINSIKEEILPQDNNISGNVAYKGIVEGIAYVIKNKDDIKNFPTGYIMVASKTQPQYVPVMAKAIAIVTDIGGITSHAAIIAREFKIPAIVGTTNASRIIKNGDKIRVNANKGIVTIIEKAK